MLWYTHYSHHPWQPVSLEIAASFKYRGRGGGGSIRRSGHKIQNSVLLVGNKHQNNNNSNSAINFFLFFLYELVQADYPEIVPHRKSTRFFKMDPESLHTRSMSPCRNFKSWGIYLFNLLIVFAWNLGSQSHLGYSGLLGPRISGKIKHKTKSAIHPNFKIWQGLIRARVQNFRV